jgi:hypothetical protein
MIDENFKILLKLKLNSLDESNHTKIPNKNSFNDNIIELETNNFIFKGKKSI